MWLMFGTAPIFKALPATVRAELIFVKLHITEIVQMLRRHLHYENYSGITMARDAYWARRPRDRVKNYRSLLCTPLYPLTLW